jgi:hypothetical protein
MDSIGEGILMAERYTYEVVIRLDTGNSIVVDREARFQTDFVSAPPADPDPKGAAPDLATAKKLFESVRSAKKVNVRVPGTAADAVHLILEIKDDPSKRALVTVLLVKKDDAKEVLVMSLDADYAAFEFKPTGGNAYVARVTARSVQVYDHK